MKYEPQYRVSKRPDGLLAPTCLIVWPVVASAATRPLEVFDFLHVESIYIYICIYICLFLSWGLKHPPYVKSWWVSGWVGHTEITWVISLSKESLSSLLPWSWDPPSWRRH